MGRGKYIANRLEPLIQTDFESSAYLNNKTYLDIYNRMKEICLNLYVYRNLPDTVDERYLELMLFEYGFSFFFKEDVADIYLSLSGTLDRGFDVYGNYTNYTAISAKGDYRQRLDSSNSVIIYNNFTRIPTRQQIELFAWRAWNALRTADTNLSQQKTTKLLKVPEQRRLTWKNLLMKIQGNQVYALVSDDIDVENCVVDLNVPYIADKAIMVYNTVWNDFLTFIGVVNHNTDKKEREVQIEVMGHMGATEMERNTMLRSRRIGFDKVNKIFGLDIEVDFNSNLSTFLQDNKILLEDEDVSFYNNSAEDSRKLQQPEPIGEEADN